MCDFDDFDYDDFDYDDFDDGCDWEDGFSPDYERYDENDYEAPEGLD